MSKRYPNTAKWEFLERIVKNLPKTKEEETAYDFTGFVERTQARYPGVDVENKLFELWKLIFRRILRTAEKSASQEVTLPDSYFEKLKKF